MALYFYDAVCDLKKANAECPYIGCSTSRTSGLESDIHVRFVNHYLAVHTVCV